MPWRGFRCGLANHSVRPEETPACSGLVAVGLALPEVMHQTPLVTRCCFPPRVVGQHAAVFTNHYTHSAVVYDVAIVSIQFAELGLYFLRDLRGTFPLVIVGKGPVEMGIDDDGTRAFACFQAVLAIAVADTLPEIPGIRDVDGHGRVNLAHLCNHAVIPAVHAC